MMPRRTSRLTMAERAALLRAARDRIQQQERDLELWLDRIKRNVPGAQQEHDIVKDEWLLLSAAVKKLWIGVTSDD